MAERFIKIYPKIMEWEWYKKPPTRILFEHCILKANWKDAKFEGVNIKRGSFVTSIKSLSDETGLTTQQIRTAIKHLKSTGELTSKIYPKFRVITVKNYNDYQEANKVTNNQLTSNQQATNNNSRINRINRINRIRESVERESGISDIFTPPTLTDIISFGSKSRIRKDYCERFYNYYVNNGWQNVTDWKAKFNYWVSKEKDKKEVYESENKSRRLE